MFNNVALDVFIGLVVIYLLYSLLVTIVGEMIVTWMGLRSRVLRVAIEKLLNDGYRFKYVEGKNFWDRTWFFLQRFFLKEFDDFKTSLAGKFYDSPTIKYLSDKAGDATTYISQKKPSYISAENFAVTLLNLLKEKGRGNSDIEKIQFTVQFNTLHAEPETLRSLRWMTTNAGDDINNLKQRLMTWYNETMDRATGWYKRKLQLILFWLSFIVVAVFNVDSIQIAKLLAKDKDARENLVRMGTELAKDSSKFKAWTNPADSIHSQSVLDSGYAQVTKDIHDANKVLGLGWGTDLLSTKDSIVISREQDSIRFETLRSDVKNIQRLYGLREQLLSARPGRIEEQRKLNDQIFQLSSDTLSLLTLMNKGITSKDSSLHIDKIQQDLQVKKDALKEANASTSVLRSISIADSQHLASTNDRIRDIHQHIQSVAGTGNLTINKVRFASNLVIGKISFKGATGDSVNAIKYLVTDSTRILVDGRRPYSSSKKIVYVVRKISGPLSLIGLLITALMLSLGAPFWFDLLKKLVAIRGAGIKPEEKKTNAADTKGAIPGPVTEERNNATPADAGEISNVYDKALRLYAGQIKNIPGVKAVFFAPAFGGKPDRIQINVDTDSTKNEVVRKYPSLTVGGIDVQKEIVVSGTPQSHAKGLIENMSRNNGFGSLGIILRDRSSLDLHLLSCWHVLKGNTDYSNSDHFRNIATFPQQTSFAQRWAGGIEGSYDYGLASINNNTSVFTNNQFLKSTLDIKSEGAIQYRHVTTDDITNHIGIRFYDAVKGKVANGLVYTAVAAGVDIKYADKTRTVEDILVLTNEQEETISQGGNSGSIVFAADDKAIAMVIGGDRNYTYAVKLSNIFDIHSEMEIV